jgi:hypothetical protein
MQMRVSAFINVDGGHNQSIAITGKLPNNMIGYFQLLLVACIEGQRDDGFVQKPNAGFLSVFLGSLFELGFTQ